jgi:hypothetical protein
MVESMPVPAEESQRKEFCSLPSLGEGICFYQAEVAAEI